MTEWLPIVQALGIPGTALFMVGFSMYKAAPWCAAKMESWIARNVQFVDAVEKEMHIIAKAQTEFQAQMLAKMGRIASELTELTQSNIRLTESNTRLAEKQAQLTEAQIVTSNEVAKRVANGK